MDLSVILYDNDAPSKLTTKECLLIYVIYLLQLIYIIYYYN